MEGRQTIPVSTVWLLPVSMHALHRKTHDEPWSQDWQVQNLHLSHTGVVLQVGILSHFLPAGGELATALHSLLLLHREEDCSARSS